MGWHQAPPSQLPESSSYSPVGRHRLPIASGPASLPSRVLRHPPLFGPGSTAPSAERPKKPFFPRSHAALVVLQRTNVGFLLVHHSLPALLSFTACKSPPSASALSPDPDIVDGLRARPTRVEASRGAQRRAELCPHSGCSCPTGLCPARPAVQSVVSLTDLFPMCCGHVVL